MKLEMQLKHCIQHGNYFTPKLNILAQSFGQVLAHTMNASGAQNKNIGPTDFYYKDKYFYLLLLFITVVFCVPQIK